MAIKPPSKKQLLAENEQLKVMVATRDDLIAETAIELEEALALSSVTEAARILGVHRATIWRWVKAGKLSGKRIGAVVLIPRGAVECLKATKEPQTEP